MELEEHVLGDRRSMCTNFLFPSLSVLENIARDVSFALDKEAL
jgi:hypothetical protein